MFETVVCVPSSPKLMVRADGPGVDVMGIPALLDVSSWYALTMHLVHRSTTWPPSVLNGSSPSSSSHRAQESTKDPPMFPDAFVIPDLYTVHGRI